MTNVRETVAAALYDSGSGPGVYANWLSFADRFLARLGALDHRVVPFAPFAITAADVGRHVQRISTGEVGVVARDPGNGWLHPGVVYEWERYRDDLEYVTVVSVQGLQGR